MQDQVAQPRHLLAQRGLRLKRLGDGPDPPLAARETHGIDENERRPLVRGMRHQPAERVLQGFRRLRADGESDCDRIARRRLGRKMLRPAAGADGVEVGQVRVDRGEGGELRRHRIAHGGLDPYAGTKKAVGHHPRSRGRPGGACGIGPVQQGGPEGQEGGDPFVDACGQCVRLERVDVRGDGEMDETVGEWCGHVEHRRAIFLAVARGPDEPAIGNPVGPHAPVEDELLCDPLERGRRHVDLVEEEDASPLARKELGRIPARKAVPCDRQAAQVRGRQLAQPQVDQFQPVRASDLGDDAGLPHPRRPPDHHAQSQVVGHDAPQ